MQNIFTKTGDQGKSSLANGKRLKKSELIFEVIGNLDELNSWLGVVVSHLNNDEAFVEQKDFLQQIQQQLFVISAELVKAKNSKLEKEFLKKLEIKSKNLQEKMSANWHSKFLLPGGCQTAAWLDVARTVCRRAERSLVKLNEQEKLRPVLLQFINRLSDYLYVVRCWVNEQQGVEEKLVN